MVRPAPTYCEGLAKSTLYRPALWHSLPTLNSHCNSLRRDEEVRRLAVESKRGLPETLTFVLDMKDDVAGSFWEMFCFFLSVWSERCIMSCAACLLRRGLNSERSRLR